MILQVLGGGSLLWKREFLPRGGGEGGCGGLKLLITRARILDWDPSNVDYMSPTMD